jgi:hypothetical protein
MRQATSRKVQKGRGTAQPFFFPAPVGGMNTRDPPALVPITEAWLMSGLYPAAAGLRLRPGYTEHTTGVSPTAVETLMVYTNNSGTESMFAARGTAFYDVSVAGALGAAVVSGLTNALWQYVNYTNSSGTAYLCAFNGTDSPRYWDGATWTAITGVSTPAITGLTTSTIISACVHQRRIFLVQVNSLKLWYLPIDSVGGAAKALELGGIAYKGGYIMAAESWTVDGGDGIDDLLVCYTSEGQVIAFSGTDPSSASTWVHTGTWDISEPINRRSLYSYRGDVLIMSRAGIASLRRVMAGDTTASAMVTDKISRTYTERSGASVALRQPWQVLYHPGADLLFWCAGIFEGYPMNATTGAWGGNFGFGASAWAIFNGEPYFAMLETPFNIYKFWTGTTDNGVAISGALYHGFSDMGSPGLIKKVSQTRALMQCTSTSTLGVGAIPDYTSDAGIISGSQVIVSSAAVNGYTNWIQALRVGTAFSAYFQVITSVGAKYNGIQFLYEPGGIVGATNPI